VQSYIYSLQVKEANFGEWKMDISACAEAAASCSGFVSTRSLRRSERVCGAAPHTNAVAAPLLAYYYKTTQFHAGGISHYQEENTFWCMH